MIDQLKRQDFTDLAPGGLSIEHEGRQIPLTVVETRDLPGSSPRAAPFAIELEGPATPLLPQAIYPVLHPLLGRLDLFVVPIARDAAHARYEVIFN
jgi:hypothetical protein